MSLAFSGGSRRVVEYEASSTYVCRRRCSTGITRCGIDVGIDADDAAVSVVRLLRTRSIRFTCLGEEMCSGNECDRETR
jgi:hypothetical protein